MRWWSAIVALLILWPAAATAQAPPSWQVDVASAAFAEAWDVNESHESLAGLIVGAERRVWSGVRVRVEGIMLRATQAGTDAWIRGFTIGARNRWTALRIKPFIDLAVGMSDATAPVPPRGTTVNFLALAGGGVHLPMRNRLALDLGARWFHLSNNGRQGRQRNPDVQALGALIAIGWVY